MPEISIVPNLHPIFVHFSIALLIVSAALFFIAALFKRRPWAFTILKIAHANLWIGALFMLPTLLTGWQAFNTVENDYASHVAMTIHRNWAIPTGILWVILAAWSAIWYRKSLVVGKLFLVLLVIASVMLAVTGHKGAETVYRYGLGVMSMP